MWEHSERFPLYSRAMLRKKGTSCYSEIPHLLLIISIQCAQYVFSLNCLLYHTAGRNHYLECIENSLVLSLFGGERIMDKVQFHGSPLSRVKIYESSSQVLHHDTKAGGTSTVHGTRWNPSTQSMFFSLLGTLALGLQYGTSTVHAETPVHRVCFSHYLAPLLWDYSAVPPWYTLKPQYTEYVFLITWHPCFGITVKVLLLHHRIFV